MDPHTSHVIVEGLITYLGLIILLTFHEFGHALVALKCGDPTAQMLGRVTLNPIKHIDPIGTVALPLIMIFASPAVGQFLVGWAKPVPVNLANFRNPKFDDILVSMAGPAMNLLLAVVLVGLARAGLLFRADGMAEICLNMALLSLLLGFFNLIPIPPLDGSHVLRNLIGMSYETYWKLSQYGFLAVILVLQIPGVRQALATATYGTLNLITYCFAFPS
jgi:Zn-dependent protease